MKKQQRRKFTEASLWMVCVCMCVYARARVCVCVCVCVCARARARAYVCEGRGIDRYFKSKAQCGKLE